MLLLGNCKRKINWFQLWLVTFLGKFRGLYNILRSQVHSERPRLSPIPSGGLEILLMAKLTSSDEKRQYLAHLNTIIEKNYQVAEKEEDDLHEQEEDICDDNEDDYLRG